MCMIGSSKYRSFGQNSLAGKGSIWRHRQTAGHADSRLCTMKYTPSFFPAAEQLHLFFQSNEGYIAKCYVPLFI